MKRRRMPRGPFLERLPRELADTFGRATSDLIARGMDFVVIGGLAVVQRFPMLPTEDIDIALAPGAAIPDEMAGLKRISRCRFKDTNGVVVDFAIPERHRVPQQVWEYAVRTAEPDASLGVRFAGPLALVAMKLCRARLNDQAQVMWAMRHGFDPKNEELLGIGLPQENLVLLEHLRAELAREAREEEEMGW